MNTAGILQRLVRPRIWILLAAIIICLVVLENELPTVLLMTGIWGIAGVGLGLLLGFAGQISLSQAAFVGVGAYSYAILTTRFEVPSLLALMAGVLIAGALAALGSPILRIRGYYLAIATIVFNLLLSALAVTSLGVPGGSAGMGGIPFLEVFGLRLASVEAYAVFSMSVLLICIVGAHLRYGRGQRWRAIQALRHDEALAGGVGLRAFALKQELFTVSGAMAGLAGGILAAAFGFISPGQFSYTHSFTLALAVFIGGSFSLWGAALGVALLQVISPLLGEAYALQGLVVGALALATVRFAPDGWVRRRENVDGEPSERVQQEYAATPNTPPEMVQGAALQTVELGKSFGSLRAVHGVSLEISPGLVTGLIGPNGAGKSTLLNLIAGELRPTQGNIQLDGHDVSGVAPFTLARLGLVRTYQQSRIITGLSVLDNILLGTDSMRAASIAPASGAAARQEAIRAAGDAGALHLLSKSTDSLTFGERRLVELARLLVSKPRLALLDEPYSGLSHREGETLERVIRTLRDRGTTVVLVEHAIPFVLSLADHLIVLQDGELLASGQPREVVELESLRTSYLGAALEGQTP